MEQEKQVEETTTETVTQSQQDNNAKQDDELQKAIQSATSKGKNELMKELGITSVADFRSKMDAVNERENKAKETETKYNDLLKANEKLEHKLILKTLNVKDELVNEFLAAVSAIDGKDFTEKATKLIEKTGSAFTVQHSTPAVKDIKIGVEGHKPTETATRDPILDKYGIKY